MAKLTSSLGAFFIGDSSVVLVVVVGGVVPDAVVLVVTTGGKTNVGGTDTCSDASVSCSLGIKGRLSSPRIPSSSSSAPPLSPSNPLYEVDNGDLGVSTNLFK